MKCAAIGRTQDPVESQDSFEAKDPVEAREMLKKILISALNDEYRLT